MLKAVYRKVSKIKTLKGNPRTIQDESFKKLCTSIKDNPQYFEARPIILSDRTGVLVSIAGNQRIKAAKFLKLEAVPTILIPDLTEEKEREIIIRDNVSNGDWDIEILENDWDLGQLEDWGVDVDFGEDEVLEAVEDDYEQPEQMQIDVVLGDLIEFVCEDGRVHRLLCGDSTEVVNVDKLLNRKKVCMVTDPPYGINANKQTLGLGKKEFHRGDDWDSEVPDFFYLVEMFEKCIIWGGNYFADKLPISNDWLCWHKKNDDRSYSEFELAWSNIGVNCRILQHHWSGEVKLHPTMKPVKVMAWCIGLVDEEIIFDPFLGSGSTMVAAHQLKKTCLGIEMSPSYCQTILNRMQKLDSTLTVKINGKQYIKEGAEVPF